MEKSLTREEEFILSLLKDSLTREKRRKDPDPGVNWNRFLILSEKHEIMSLLYDVMPVDTPKEILDVIRLRARQTVQKYYRMFFLTKYYVEKLRKAGIQVFFREFEGCFHGFDMLAYATKPARDARRFLKNAFRYALDNYSAENR